MGADASPARIPILSPFGSPIARAETSPTMSPIASPTMSPIVMACLWSLCHEVAGLGELVLSGSAKALASPTGTAERTGRIACVFEQCVV
jgi:hypothetical protein